MQKDQLKILLLQIRQQPQVRAEEHASFAAYSGLAEAQIHILNVFDTPQFNHSVLNGYDALYVGGASEASVLEPHNYPFIESSIQLLRHCAAAEIPVFASCFGFQLAVLALGGTIIRDQTDYEMGTVPMRLAAGAKTDPVFKNIADGFAAVSVHKERTTELPQGCELLAYTDACVHSFRLLNKPFWAFQFHPELNRATLVERLTIFQAQYTDGDDHLNKVLSSAIETPEANKLVANFVNRVLLDQ